MFFFSLLFSDSLDNLIKGSTLLLFFGNKNIDLQKKIILQYFPPFVNLFIIQVHVAHGTTLRPIACLTITARAQG